MTVYVVEFDDGQDWVVKGVFSHLKDAEKMKDTYGWKIQWTKITAFELDEVKEEQCH